MPTRSARKKIARIQKRHGPNIDKSWEDLLDRHRSNKPSTRRLRRKRILFIAHALAKAGMVIRPEEFTPDHTAFLLAAWHRRGLSKNTVDALKSTICWIGHIYDRQLVP